MGVRRCYAEQKKGGTFDDEGGASFEFGEGEKRKGKKEKKPKEEREKDREREQTEEEARGREAAEMEALMAELEAPESQVEPSLPPSPLSRLLTEGEPFRRII